MISPKKIVNKTQNKLIKKILTADKKPAVSLEALGNYYTNKVAVITGAGSGIGKQLALALANLGCHLAISDINEEALIATKNEITAYGVKCFAYPLDVSNKSAMQAFAKNVIQDFSKVHFVFNNAGVALSATVEGGTYEEYEWIMGINFWGVVYGTKEFLPLIKQNDDGYIINISSLFGLTSQPTQSGYNASKFAVRGFTESLQQELALTSPHIGALSVHPGGIKTNIANSARMNDSIRVLGINPLKSAKKFNKMLVKPPEEAANEILEAVFLKKKRLLIGNDAIIFDKVQRLLPTGYQRITQSIMNAKKS